MFLPIREDNPQHQPQTVVIQPYPGIGDMVWHLPALKALAAADPTGQVDLVTHRRVPVQALLKNEGTVSRYFLFALRSNDERNAALRAGNRLARISTFWQRIYSVFGLAWALRRGKYRRAYIFHQSARYVLAARLAGIPEVYAFGIGLQNIMLTHPDPLPPGSLKMMTQDRAHKFLAAIGIAQDMAPARLHPDPNCVKANAETYAGFATPWVGMAIGSARANNIWPPERFAMIADALWQAGYRSLFLLGAAHETTLAQKVVSHCRLAKPVLVTDQPLDRAIALLSQCAFSFCNDSGLMNVAAALGVPSYSLSGTVAPNVFSPFVHPITPESGPDPVLGASKITVERALAKLSEDGIIPAPDETGGQRT